MFANQVLSSNEEGSAAHCRRFGGVAGLRIVQRVLRVGHCSVRRTAAGRGAHFRVVQKGLRGAVPSVKDMVEVSVVCIRVEVCAQRVCMGELCSV